MTQCLNAYDERNLMLNGARTRTVCTPMSRHCVAAAQAARAVRGVGRKVIL
jgi:hypothetical protein